MQDSPPCNQRTLTVRALLFASALYVALPFVGTATPTPTDDAVFSLSQAALCVVTDKPGEALLSQPLRFTPGLLLFFDLSITYPALSTPEDFTVYLTRGPPR